MFHDPSLKTRRPKQVFTSAGASGILVNDLVRILGDCGQNGVEADTVQDNIFQWNVKLSRFEGTTQLGEDLARVNELYGYGYIELQLDFSMDLYPFFPPLVKVGPLLRTKRLRDKRSNEAKRLPDKRSNVTKGLT